MNTLELNLFTLGMYTMLTLIGTVVFFARYRRTATSHARQCYLLMSCLMGVITFQCVIALLFELYASRWGYDISSPYYIGLSVLFDFLAVPCIGLLIMAVTRTIRFSLFHVLLHVLPFVALWAAYLLLLEDFIMNIGFVYFYLYAAGVLTYSFYRVHLYQKALLNNYADTTARSLRWVYVVNTLFIVQYVVWYLTHDTGMRNLSYTIYHLFSLCTWSLMCHMMSRQVLDVEDVAEELSHSEKRVLTISDRKMTELDDIVQQLVTEGIYLHPDLTCTQMASAARTNRTYLSTWFHEHDTTFNDYINSLRLEKAVELLETTSLSIQEVTEQSGFNHPNTFRNVFRDKYGCTPKQYRVENAAR